MHRTSKRGSQQHIKHSCKRHEGKPTFPPWMMFKANENNCFLQRAIERSGKPSTPFNVYRFLIENQSALRKLLRLCCYLSQKLNLTWLRKLQEKAAFPNCQVAGSNTIQCFATRISSTVRAHIGEPTAHYVNQSSIEIQQLLRFIRFVAQRHK